MATTVRGREVAPSALAQPSRWQRMLAFGLASVLFGSFAGLARKATRPTAGFPALRTAPPAPERARFVDRFDVRTFQRGSIHFHSLLSDGDSPVADVLGWYRSRGYQFAALTDHNGYFDPRQHRGAETSEFVVLPGEEVSMTAEGMPIHVNALCTEHAIGGGSFEQRGAALQWAVDQIRGQGGVALLNHPNFWWSLETQHLAAVRGATLLEIFSGHPGVRWAGDGTHSSVESKWQDLLALGSGLAPVAVDDAHTFQPVPSNETDNGVPGMGWVNVFAEQTSAEAICDGLAKGRLYASSGPKLVRIAVRDATFSLWLDDPDAVVEFFAPGGSGWSAAFPEPDPDGRSRHLLARYTLGGAEQFVRARITDSEGHMAWTAAYRVTR